MRSMPDMAGMPGMGGIGEGSLDLDTLVTARFRLDQITEAKAAIEAGKIAGRATLVL